MPPEPFLLRRLAPADAERVQEFVRHLSPQSRLERFFSPVRELTPRQLQRATAEDDELINVGAFAPDGSLIGIGQCAVAGGEAEFGVVVADAWQGSGLGRRLLESLLLAARQRGLITVYGVVRERNRPMLKLAHRLGFRSSPDADPALVRIELPLSHA